MRSSLPERRGSPACVGAAGRSLSASCLCCCLELLRARRVLGSPERSSCRALDPPPRRSPSSRSTLKHEPQHGGRRRARPRDTAARTRAPAGSYRSGAGSSISCSSGSASSDSRQRQAEIALRGLSAGRRRAHRTPAFVDATSGVGRAGSSAARAEVTARRASCQRLCGTGTRRTRSLSTSGLFSPVELRGALVVRRRLLDPRRDGRR